MRSAVRRVQRGRWCRDCGSCRGKEWRGLESRTRYGWRGIGSVRRLRRCCFASREVETSILRVSWVGARRQQWALGIGKAPASESGRYTRKKNPRVQVRHSRHMCTALWVGLHRKAAASRCTPKEIDEGMVAVRGGVDVCEDAGGAAEAGGAWGCVGWGVFTAFAAAETAKDCGSQFADGISGMDRGAAAWGDEWNDAQLGLDGGGICTVSEIFEGEY